MSFVFVRKTLANELEFRYFGDSKRISPELLDSRPLDERNENFRYEVDQIQDPTRAEYLGIEYR